MNRWNMSTLSLFLTVCLAAATWKGVDAFVALPPPQRVARFPMTTVTVPSEAAWALFPSSPWKSAMSISTTSGTKLAAVPIDMDSSTTLTTAAATVDPTSFLSDILGSVLGTPLILAIPIIAALGVAGIVAFLIISYASPAESDE